MPNLLHHAWQKTVRRSPDARALIDAASGKCWTRAELAATADNWLRSLPGPPDLAGRIVVMAEPNGIEWWRVFLGLISAGAVPAALDVHESLATQHTAAAAIGASWLWRDGTLESVPASSPRRRLHTCALIKLTSGSTGTPKAFKFTAEQMLADARHIVASMKIKAEDLNLGVIPFGHSYGLGNLVMPLIDQGTALLCATSPLPQAIAIDCAKWQPTIFPAVPAHLRLLTASDIPSQALFSLRLVISAGSVLPAVTAASFDEKFGRRVHSFYGSSETGGICFDRTGEASLDGRSVGTPLEGVTLEMLRGGRFAVRSAAVFGRGRFSPSDRGQLDTRGELVLIGRAGRMLKIGGRRLDLGEIETALRTIPGVHDAFAVSHPQRMDELAVAVATSLSSREVRSALNPRLPAWKIPARIVTLPTFPLTPRGKTHTAALRVRLARS